MASILFDQDQKSFTINDLVIVDKEIYTYLKQIPEHRLTEEVIASIKAGMHVLISEELGTFLDSVDNQLTEKCTALRAEIADFSVAPKISAITDDQALYTRLSEVLSGIYGDAISLITQNGKPEYIQLQKDGKTLTIEATMKTRPKEIAFDKTDLLEKKCLVAKECAAKSECHIFAIDKSIWDWNESVHYVSGNGKYGFAVRIDVENSDFNNLESIIDVALSLLINGQRTSSELDLAVNFIDQIIGDLSCLKNIKDSLDASKASIQKMEQEICSRAEAIKNFKEIWDKYVLTGTPMTNMQKWDAYVAAEKTKIEQKQAEEAAKA